jgi:cytochrome oxidase Cu insertion factor (SCO1/SenC/PrrC family)
MGNRGLAQMNRRWSWVLGVLALGWWGSGAAPWALEAFRPLVAAQQRPAPPFTLPDYRGQAVQLDELRGNVVVIRFWASW